MNMTQYPALHYPEVYILEGGYARYHAHSPQHCQGSYVSMDDPNHRRDRQADLSHFRTREHAASSRAKSFTYGENHATVSRNCSLPQKTAPLLVPAPGSQLSPQQQARQL
jgi:M-phase inducer tyrosine phosphatase